jgi:diguanylate cyclase (GGDEF)-like protein
MDSLAEASQRDGMTGTYNRRFLEESIAKEFNRMHRYGGIMSLVMLDIDHFKFINDTHGHLAGDEVLRAASKRLNTIVRFADTLGRYGGEEFCVLLPETTMEGARAYAERIRCTEEANIHYETTAIHATISIGAAQYHDKMADYEELLKAADEAVYLA